MDEFTEIDQKLHKTFYYLQEHPEVMINFYDLNRMFYRSEKYCKDDFLRESIKRTFVDIIELKIKFDQIAYKESLEHMPNWYYKDLTNM